MRVAFLLILLSCVSVRISEAQPRAAAPPNSRDALAMLRDYSERRFGSPDGLRSLAVYAVEAFPDGSLWIGTDAGPHRFVGARLELVTIPVANAHVRGIARTSDGGVWFATRQGVVHRDTSGASRLYGAANGLPGGTVYSLVVSNAYDGQERVIAAANDGIAVMRDGTWYAIPLPDGMRPGGLVARARPRAGRRDDLWIGNMHGAAARWRDGRWERFGAPEGLETRALEHFAVLDDQQRTLYAATSNGVFVLNESNAGDRFVRVPGSPANAYRMAAVPKADGSHELWVGTLDGLLMRRRGVEWDTLQLRSTEPRTPVHALIGVRGHAGGYAIYVGTLGDGLVRLSVGRGATLVSEQTALRLSITSVLEQPNGRRDVVWIGTNNFGVIEIEGARARPLMRAEEMGDGRSSALFVRDTTPAAEVWVGGALGAWQRIGDQWVDRREGLGRTTVRRFTTEREDRPQSPLLVASDSGLLVWARETWRRVPGTPAAAVRTVLGETASDRSLWIAGAGFGTMVRRDGQWSTDSSAKQFADGLIVHRFCRMSLAEDERLLAGGNHGVLWRARDGTAWQALPLRLREFLRSDMVHDLRCDQANRVLVATLDGVAVLDLSGRDTTAWHMVTMLGPADGLPSPAIQVIGEGGAAGPRWIGTSHGVGRIDVQTLPLPDASLFSMRVLRGNAVEPVLDRERVAFEDHQITIALALPTFHREEDVRYRIVVDGPLPRRGGEWTADPTVSYPAMPPGAYTVRAWARDYAGREYGPVTQRFSVAYPPWRSPLAWLGYALAAAVALLAAHRWRLRTLRDRAAELSASEQRARASERQFRALFDRAFDANLLVRDGRVIAANAAAVSLFGGGTALDGALAASLSLPVSLADGSAVTDAVETEVRSLDDRAIPVAVTVTSIDRDDGPVHHWVLRDLSAVQAARAERQLLESQVREAQKLESLGTLAGGVAHDFNNLLVVIRGNAELARDALQDPDEVAGHLEAVLDASERARDLVRQILTFSRRNTPHERVLDLGAVVRALVPMLRSLIPRTVDLQLTAGTAAYSVRGDVTQVQQLLFNLCSNAEYAMRPTNGGRLEIRLDVLPAPDDVESETSRVVRLRVRDTGVGMTDEVRDRLFEPFFTTKPTGEGTGLGLSVLHGIVASHGGRVRVHSAPGAGSTFDVLLPLVTDGAVAALASTATPIHGTPAASLRPTAQDDAAILLGKRVMLVDDEPAVARVVERALTRLGCRVRTFTDPSEALHAIAQAPGDVDLLVTDQTMPGMTGDVLSEAAHALRPSLPVVIVTGYSYRLTPDRLVAVGASAVLQKPVALAILSSTVAAVLRGDPVDLSATAS